MVSAAIAADEDPIAASEQPISNSDFPAMFCAYLRVTLKFTNAMPPHNLAAWLGFKPFFNEQNRIEPLHTPSIIAPDSALANARVKFLNTAAALTPSGVHKTGQN